MSSFRAGKIMVKTVSSEQILDSNLSQTSELHASHLSFFRILFIPEKCRPGNSCQGQKERKKNISNCLIMQWAGSVQTHVV